MIDIKLLREEPEKVKKGIAAKGVGPEIVGEFLKLDEAWRKATQEIESLRAEQKKASEERNVEAGKKLKDAIKVLEEDLKTLDGDRGGILDRIPNIPFDDVPRGKSAEDNIVLREAGKKREFDFEPQEYLKLAENLGLINIEKAAEVAGSRFGYVMRDAVLLEFALIQFALDTLLSEGFIPVLPPVLLKPDIMKRMGKMKFIEDEDLFYIPKDDLYLAGSSEHTTGPLHMNETFEEKDLPKRYVAFSTCFRREAGSYGKDTKGILRVHQFDKVEMFSFAKPEASEKEHAFLLSLQEKLMGRLGLPYRIVEICTGDMGWADARQYDLETWLPSQKTYRETHSASNTSDFQARGIRAKYKNGPSGADFVHMLNATGFAMGRTLIAIIENYQTKDGTIMVPQALQKYLGKEMIG